MSTIGATLKEIHRLRRHLRELQTEIERVPRTLKARLEYLAKQESEFKAAQDALKHLKVAIHEKEVSLKSTHGSIAKFEKQLAEASNQKEYESRQSEIATARTKCEQLEEAILLAMAELDERTGQLPEQEKKLQNLRQETTAFESDLNEKLRRWQAEKTRAEAELTAVEGQLQPEIRPQYHRLIKSYGADGLAGVKGDSCQQCRTRQTAQAMNDLRAGRFVCCGSCGRGLYVLE